MPLFNSLIRLREIATTVVVEVLILVALGFAVVRYVEWSSDAAMAEFLSGEAIGVRSDLRPKPRWFALLRRSRSPHQSNRRSWKRV
jgi:hypothetical protein